MKKTREGGFVEISKDELKEGVLAGLTYNGKADKLYKVI